jgi:uncharacterized membrane protein YfcA
MQIFCLVLLGAVSGIVSGLLGLGGAIIVIPALVYFFGFNELSAQGTSLAMLLPPIGLLAAWRYWKEGHVDLTAACVLALSFFVFSYLGANAAVRIPDALMKRIFGIAMVAIGMFMILEKGGK